MSIRARRLPVLALLAALVLAAATSAQKVFRDDKYGFDVKTVSKWVGVPIQPTEKTTVAKWASPRNERNYPGRMYVHLFDRRKDEKRKELEELEGKLPKTVDLSALFNQKARSFQSWIRRNRRGLELPAPEQIQVKTTDGKKIRANVYTTEYGAMKDPRFRDRVGYYTVILVVTLPDKEYAVELSCGAAVKKKYRGKFRKVIESFRLRADGIKPTAAKVEPGSGQPNPQRTERDAAREEARRRAREDKTRVKGWWYVESENYLIVTNTPAKRKGRIRDLKRRLEAMRSLYERDFPPREPIKAISIVRVCKDNQSYYQYGGRPGTGGYWYSAAKELVLFHRGDKNFARSVLNHEAFHQYIYYACGEINPHIWYNEGHADYYGGADVIGNRAVIKPNRMRVDTIKTAMRTGQYVPLPTFLNYTQGQYYRKAGLCYAQGWSLAYFLNRGIERAHPWSQIVPTYYRVLLETGKSKKAHEAAFKGVDLAALDEAWKAYITRKKKVRA